MVRYFSIGGLTLSLECDPCPYRLSLEDALESFACEPCEKPDIRFVVDIVSPFPVLDGYTTIFTSNPGGLWTILEDTGKTHYLIALQNIASDEAPYRIIRADRRFSDFTIHTKPTPEGRISPLEYPLADLAVSGHLNINRIGIILHSACVSTGGRGLLFSGVSGAGKSTIAELWRQDPDSVVLTDERAIIRDHDGDLWAYGTPWHGTSTIHKNMGAPVHRVFFIKHGKRNRVSTISMKDAANRLMVRCFPTFWNREGMRFALEFCARVAGEKECSEFEFVKKKSAVEHIKRL